MPNSDPNSWREAKAVVLPGNIWDYRRGYKVQKAGQHESPEQFRAFQIYLNLGIERNISAVSEMTKKTPLTLSKWSKRWNWERRVVAWDKREVALAFKEANKMQQQAHRNAIDQFRNANEKQAKMMMGVSSDLVNLVKKRIELAEERGEEIPMSQAANLLRAASSLSETGSKAWATSLGVTELMAVVDTELEEVQVAEIEGEDVYDVPIDE